MTPLAELFAQGTAHAWLFIPSALLLGALHGLEPGHSKTMMAAFIVAVRGTVWQAILLGLSATLSHTAIVWAIGLAGIYFGRNLDVNASEPWLQLISALIILSVAAWMIWRTWREGRAEAHEHDHQHGHDETHRIDTGHGAVALSIYEDGVPPCFRIASVKGLLPSPREVTVTTTRDDGSVQTFSFADRVGFLESIETIPEPHAFEARLTITHGHHAHDFDVTFAEHDHDHGHHDHGHDHAGLDVNDPGYRDAHERAHANDIKRRFAGREVTTGQIILFGLTGGLIPCPAAITVLLLCLQLKQVALGATLVLCFSVGLAVTMVTVGVVAALGVRHAEKRFSGAFSTFARKAPYASSAVIAVVGLIMAITSLQAILR